MLQRNLWGPLFVLMLLLMPASLMFGQLDQGTITGVVQDQSGAVIANASVTLKNVDEGQILKAKTDNSGVYVFSPIKIGNYSVSVSAPNFETTTQTNLHLNIQQRLSADVTLQAGSMSETVTVTSETPLMQTQESSVGQTMDTQTINSVPLASRNWVYIAQLAAGAALPEGSRGAGKGDFQANGQRAEENNFILDGIDNNVNVVDFYNAASYVVNPPPDALAEFKLQTSDYSAEFGHSAGAVLNASTRSGSNTIHGSLWEYIRNTAFDIHVWNPSGVLPVSPYHENQFGATLGGPIFRNRLFLFSDLQATRISYAEPNTSTVPTAKERMGNFSELLNDSLTGYSNPVQLYHQTSTAAPVPFNNNCLVTSSSCTSSVPGVTLNPTALAMLNDYPAPNANGGLLTNNFVSERPVVDNTFQWDVRLDYNISAKDLAYTRYSYTNEVGYNTPPLGPILDGGGFGDDGKQKVFGASYMASETHIFTPTLTNEVRFGFTYLHTGFEHPNASNLNFAASQGFGGIPQSPMNGGLPAVSLNSLLSNFGSPTWSTTDEHENLYQIIDNVTKIAGNHTLKAGVSYENIRFSTLQPQNARGSYSYTGANTSNLTSGGATVSNTGSGIADFLLDQQNNAGLSNVVTNGDQRLDNAVYFEDDWRATHSLSFNLGLRWEYFQPYQDVGGNQASFNPIPGSFSFNSTTGTGSGKGQYLIPAESYNAAMSIIGSAAYSPNYATVLAEDGINIVKTANPHLLNAQHTNFAPRIGVAWSPSGKMAVRGGFGIFYGGLESLGYWPNLGENYPFQFTGSFPSASCTANSCPTDGITIANGFSTILANGFASNTIDLTMRGADPNPRTPYTEDYNLSVERSLTNDMVATASYVGNVSRHLQINVDANSPLALIANGGNTEPLRPFPHSGGTASVVYDAVSDYNALQTKIEKRMSHGYNLLATYTWSHALDDANTPLGSTGDIGQQNYNLIPIGHDYSQSPWDTRQRFTFNALYQLPFGTGRAFLSDSKVADLFVGGWSANATFVAQTGNYFTVTPSGISAAAGGTARAIEVGNPYAGGGTSSNGVTCPTSVRNYHHWYNSCAFTNPWDSAIGPHAIAAGTYVTTEAQALNYLGGGRNTVSGPGYERVNMSVFKDFKTFREQTLTFRTDIFNLFNTPALAQPNDMTIGNNAGQITTTRSLQRYSPDSRFFQMSLKYAF